MLPQSFDAPANHKRMLRSVAEVSGGNPRPRLAYDFNSVFPRRMQREQPVSMLRLRKRMTTLRLKKSGNAEEADPVVADSDSAAAAADAEKRMSMMRLKKPSMMRLRRLPKNRSVSMLRLKKAMTQLRLKRDPFEIDDAEEEEAEEGEKAGRGGEDVPACVWIKGVCVALDEVSGKLETCQ